MKHAVVALSVLVASPAAHADANADAFGEAVQLKSTDYYRGWSISKLTTWKVGKKCLAKMIDGEGRIMSLAQFMTTEIAGYAKTVTGDDWATVEGSGTSEKAAHKATVEKMVDQMKGKFSLTVSVEGDDCDGGFDPLWMQYVMRAVEDVHKMPPAAGKAIISIETSAKTKAFTVSVSKDGSTFKLKGPIEVAASHWQNDLEAAFQKVAKK